VTDFAVGCHFKLPIGRASCSLLLLLPHFDSHTKRAHALLAGTKDQDKTPASRELLRFQCPPSQG